MALEHTIRYLGSLEKRENMHSALEIVLEEAQKNCPVDTGKLRDSGKITDSGTDYKIVFDTDYAIYVHEDLTKHHDNGEAKFLEKAWRRKRDEFLKELMKG